ncbi:MAG: HD domain-containing protein [Candidatus Sericytochromatia bacterium]|nr:HD domain-containing protein [Candidatus Tanganyikabacteria bacterium]
MPNPRKPAAGSARKQAAPPPPAREERSLAVRREAKAAFERVLSEWRELGKLDLPAVRRIVEEYVLLVPGDAKQAPPDLRVTGEYALAHPLNMLGYCLQVGKAMGYSGNDLRALGAAALLHDFGKEIPESHPDREALARLDDHCRTGNRLLVELCPGMPREVAEAVRDHHERTDGRGPMGSKKASDLAAIIAMCDVFDSRVTHHPFRGATSPHVSFRLTVNQGAGFPREVVDAFCAAIVPYPLGAPVFLVDGRRGEVVEVDPDNATTPIVLIDGERADLREDPGNRVCDLVRGALPI